MSVFRLFVSTVPLALTLLTASSAYACDCGKKASEQAPAEAKEACGCGAHCDCGDHCSCSGAADEKAGCACKKDGDEQAACDCADGACGCASGACGCGH